MSKEMKEYKNDAIKAAIQLQYEETFIQRLIRAQSEIEIAHIMWTARG